MENRLLALDGGGIRGFFAITILERIEQILKERFAKDNPNFVLADYFSMIGGTSTGAILAALLSKGLSVSAIIENYEELSPIVFKRKPLWKSWRTFYGSESFARILQKLFEESPGEPMKLGSQKLRTLLLMVMRNGTTGSTWPITNHPAARYNRRREDGSPSNLDIPLWQLIRASAAAPVFFPTELVSLFTRSGEEKRFEFIDGGISPYNCPAVAVYLASTLPPYGIKMAAGSDRLFLCSVGTGTLPVSYAPGELGRINVVGGALRSLNSLMDAVLLEQDKLCRVLGKTIYGGPLDREIEDLANDGLGQFLYSRYQHKFTKDEIVECRKTSGSKRPFALDDLKSVPLLLKIGRQYAASAVQPNHLP